MPTGAKSKKKAVRAAITDVSGNIPPVKTIAKKKKPASAASSASPSRLPCFFIDNGIRQIKLPDVEATAHARFSRVNGDRMQAYLSETICYWGCVKNGDGERIFRMGKKGEVSAERIMFMLASVMLKSTGYSTGLDVQGESLRVVRKLTTFLVRTHFFTDKLDMIDSVYLGDVKFTNFLSIFLCNEASWAMFDSSNEDSLENQLCHVLASYSAGSGDMITAYDIVMIAMWKTISGFITTCETGNFSDIYLVKEDAIMRANAISHHVRVGVLAAALDCKPEDVHIRLLQLIRHTVNHAMYFLLSFTYTYIEDFVEYKMLDYYKVEELRPELSKKHDRFSTMLKLVPFMRVHKADYVMMYGDSLNCMKTFYIHCLVDFVTMGPVNTGEVHNLFFYGVDLSDETNSAQLGIFSFEEMFGESFKLNSGSPLFDLFKPHFLGAVELERAMRMSCNGSKDAHYYFFPVHRIAKDGLVPAIASFRIDSRMFEKADIADDSVEILISRDVIWDHIHMRVTRSYPLCKLRGLTEICLASVMSTCLESIVDDSETREQMFGKSEMCAYDACIVTDGVIDYATMNCKGACDFNAYFSVEMMRDIFENVVNLADGSRIGMSVGAFTTHLLRNAFDLVEFDDHSYIQLYIAEDGRHCLDVMQHEMVVPSIPTDIEVPAEDAGEVTKNLVDCSQSSSIDLSARAVVAAPASENGGDTDMTEMNGPEEPPLDDDIFDFTPAPIAMTPEEKRMHLKKLVAAMCLEQIPIIEEFSKMKYDMCVAVSDCDYWAVRAKTIFTDITLQVRDFIICFVQVFAMRKAGITVGANVRQTLYEFPPDKIHEAFEHVKGSSINTGNMPERMKKLADHYLPFFFEC